jgi:hypothetical protein
LFEEGFSKRYMQRNPHVVLLNGEFYHSHIKHVVAQWVVLHLRSRRISALLPTDRAVQYLTMGYSDDVAASAAAADKLRASLDFEVSVLWHNVAVATNAQLFCVFSVLC